MTGLTVAVDIPEGTSDGDIITLRGFGLKAFGGGPPGDLNVIISVIPDPRSKSLAEPSASSFLIARRCRKLPHTSQDVRDRPSRFPAAEDACW